MTEHDKVRRDRALRCDLDDIKSLEDAVVGLQSTDDPSLVPLHDKLFARLQELQRRRKVMSEKTIPEQVAERSFRKKPGSHLSSIPHQCQVDKT